LGKRKGSHGAGKHALPGGHLELGESWIDCAVREVHEETNLNLNLNLGAKNPRLVTVTNDIMKSEGKHYITLFVIAKAVDPSTLKNMEPEKCEKWEWIPWQEIGAKSPLFLPLKNVIDDAEKNAAVSAALEEDSYPKNKKQKSNPKSSFEGLRILVDMDNTVVDWDSEFIKRLSENDSRTTEKVRQIVQNRKHFEMEKNFPPDEESEIIKVIEQPGFYQSLNPYSGAVEALKEMVACRADVRLLTSPHPACAAECAAEKFRWVISHLGASWIDRLIIARDKTHTNGHILVDDKPKISGTGSATWRHVVYSQAYNSHVTDRPRLNGWTGNWREILIEASSAQ